MHLHYSTRIHTARHFVPSILTKRQKGYDNLISRTHLLSLKHHQRKFPVKCKLKIYLFRRISGRDTGVRVCHSIN